MARLFTGMGYSVVETNQIAAVRTGQIVSQYEMDTTLATAGAQQGQLLVVDDKAKKIKLPAAGTDYTYLHASEERIYDPALGRNSFIVTSPNLPRLMKLNKGDKFETNAVDKGAYADKAAITTAIGAGKVYGIPMTTGDIKLVASVTNETTVLEVVEFVTLPNGFDGIKFVVVTA